MSSTISNKHVWANSRVDIREDMIVLYERKPFETGCVLVFIVVPVLAWIWVVVRAKPPNQNQIDWAIVVGMIGLIVGLAVLVLYRPSRVLRLYPLERVAHVGRRFFWLRFPGRWHDLSQEPLTVSRLMVLSDKREASAGSLALGCLLLLLGPVGLLFALFGLFAPGRNDGKIREPVYALTTRNAAGKPLALIKNKADSMHILHSYQVSAGVTDHAEV